MLLKSTLVTVLAIAAFLGASPAPALADPRAESKPAFTDWRAIFQTPKYNKPCPLTVYSEDLSGWTQEQRANASPPEERAAMSATGSYRN